MKFYERVISDFGGYEKCKDILSQPNINFIMNAQGLREHMLEYRRQHNIFEHGDYIVWLFDYEPAHLYTVKHITDKSYDYGNDWGWYGVLSNKGVGHNFRHATDAEIKAGKRLEVK